MSRSGFPSIDKTPPTMLCWSQAGVAPEGIASEAPTKSYCIVDIGSPSHDIWSSAPEVEIWFPKLIGFTVMAPWKFTAPPIHDGPTGCKI